MAKIITDNDEGEERPRFQDWTKLFSASRICSSNVHAHDGLVNVMCVCVERSLRCGRSEM